MRATEHTPEPRKGWGWAGLLPPEGCRGESNSGGVTCPLLKLVILVPTQPGREELVGS